MIFHPKTTSKGAFLASLLSVAFVGGLNLFGSTISFPFLLVSAEYVACDIALELTTWEDKALPNNKVPVPSSNVLKYGIMHVIAERFDINAGKDNFMTANNFASYSLQEDNADPLNDLAETLENSSNDAVSNVRRALVPSGMPPGCWRNYKCKAAYYKRWRSRLSSGGRILIGFCNLCREDDDDGFRRGLNLGKVPRQLTLDQLIGETEIMVTNEDHENDDSSLGTNAAHQGFERDVCAELHNLQEDFPSFKRSEGCKITFHCKNAEEEEGEQEDDLTIVDHRDDGDDDGGEKETDERDMLYSVAKWSMNGEGNEDDAPLYSVTADP